MPTCAVLQVMTKDVVTAKEGCTLEEANQILKDSKKVRVSPRCTQGAAGPGGLGLHWRRGR